MSRYQRRSAIFYVVMAVLAAGAVAWAVFVIADAIPPRRVVLTTGPEGGAYRELGEKYRKILARSHVTLELKPSLGNVENLARLKDKRSGVSAGFVTGGLTNENESPDILSLGTVGYYPLWIFCRGNPAPVRLFDLRGKRVSIGPEGGGTRPLMLAMLGANGMENSIDAVDLSPGPSGDALLAGKLDCAAMLTSEDAPIVRKLLADESVSLFHFMRADAYVAHFPFLRKVVVPEGSGDLSENRPPHDVTLVASPTSLLIREDLHPAIQFLLLQAADEVHSPGGILHKPNQFPSPEPVDVPLSADARPFYKSGGSFLQRHLPFWLWVFTSHLLLLLIPIAGIIYPLVRLVPWVIDMAIDLRLARLYAELRGIERRIEKEGPTPAVASAFHRLEEKVSHTYTPNRLARLLYILRQHLELVRERLQAP